MVKVPHLWDWQPYLITIKIYYTELLSLVTYIKYFLCLKNQFSSLFTRFFSSHKNINKIHLYYFKAPSNFDITSPGQVAQLVRCCPVQRKVANWVPRSEHMAKLRAQSPGGGMLEAANQCIALTFMLLYPSPFLSLNINKNIF